MQFKRYLIIGVSIIVAAIIINTFFLRIAKIDTVFTSKNRIIINKLAFGPRLPITLLTIPFTRGKVYSDLIILKAKRIHFGSIQRLDVVAYNNPKKIDYPIDKRELELGRIVALPGEELFIRKGEIKLNGAYIEDIDDAQFAYRVTCDSVKFPEELLEKYQITHLTFIANPFVYDIIMPANNEDALLEESKILNVRKLNTLPGKMDYTIYPGNNYYLWNKDNIGPVVIPQKGMTIEFNFKNYYLYRDIIEIHENNQIFIQGEKILCNGHEFKNYTFKNDYYYVLNDNRAIGKDSRYFGFIPESHIIGMVRNY